MQQHGQQCECRLCGASHTTSRARARIQQFYLWALMTGHRNKVCAGCSTRISHACFMIIMKRPDVFGMCVDEVGHNNGASSPPASCVYVHCALCTLYNKKIIIEVRRAKQMMSFCCWVLSRFAGQQRFTQ